MSTFNAVLGSVREQHSLFFNDLRPLMGVAKQMYDRPRKQIVSSSNNYDEIGQMKINNSEEMKKKSSAFVADFYI